MSSPNLLITGANGFVGFKVLISALKDGYTVRAAVRSSEKSKALSSHPKIVALGMPDKLSFVEVPDICREGAYDEAIKGVTYVIHHASPLPSPLLDPRTEIYEPTIKSVSTVLQAALNEPTVKKVVITSSAFANTPLQPDTTKEIIAESRVPDLPGPFDSMFPAYIAGKIAALNMTDRFMKDKQPSLSVQGLNTGSNSVLLAIITGKSADGPMPAGATHVSDAAKVHLLALKEGVAKDVGVITDHRFNDAWSIVSKHFPKAVGDGVFTQGDQPTVPRYWDAHQTEVDLAFNFKTYEDMVVDVAGQYLELLGKQKA
ncbi:putative cinnamoyl-CoA reductase [Hypoxylon crocopeplum]|nr:putative cinnamoyl-CoA reductase [Hypoxylon crocopeplum]